LAASEEEAPLVFVDDALSHLELDAHLHREEELMPLEERSASLFVDLQGVPLGDALDSILEHLVSTLFDGFHEKSLVPVKTELVHWVDLVQVIQHEE